MGPLSPMKAPLSPSEELDRESRQNEKQLFPGSSLFTNPEHKSEAPPSRGINQGSFPKSGPGSTPQGPPQGHSHPFKTSFAWFYLKLSLKKRMWPHDSALTLTVVC